MDGRLEPQRVMKIWGFRRQPGHARTTFHKRKPPRSDGGRRNEPPNSAPSFCILTKAAPNRAPKRVALSFPRPLFAIHANSPTRAPALAQLGAGEPVLPAKPSQRRHPAWPLPERPSKKRGTSQGKCGLEISFPPARLPSRTKSRTPRSSQARRAPVLIVGAPEKLPPTDRPSVCPSDRRTFAECGGHSLLSAPSRRPSVPTPCPSSPLHPIAPAQGSDPWCLPGAPPAGAEPGGSRGRRVGGGRQGDPLTPLHPTPFWEVILQTLQARYPACT